jgi:hypothetical protein
MPILEFESSAAKGPAPKKPLKLVLGAGVLVGALALGSTFAANINLNSNNNVEFGQGFVATTACDPDGITVTPFSTFINATGGGEHRLSSIRLSGIDSSDGACAGKTFRIRAYGDGPDPLNLFNWTERDINGEFMYEEVYDFVDVTRTATDFLWTSGGTDNDDVINKVNTPITESAFTINLVSIPVDGPPGITRTPLALADDVKKITVESRDAFAAAPVSYSVGDTGPSGGIIFYVAETPFACGPTLNEVCQYLEAAPNNWSGAGVGVEDPRRTWAAAVNQSTSVAGAVGTAIGTGFANSIAIAEQAGNDATNSAAALALGYSGGGAEDWYLPSSEELRELWQIRIEPHIILERFSFWSSTQNAGNAGQAWDSGGADPVNYAAKSSDTPVRPIRAFSGSLT